MGRNFRTRSITRPGPNRSRTSSSAEPPPNYVRDHIALHMAENLLHARAYVGQGLALPRDGSRTALPRSVPVSTPLLHGPTHVLAVHEDFEDGTLLVEMTPVHEDVFNLHCASARVLPRRSSTTPTNHLPVEDAPVPHLASFFWIIEYMYSHRQDVLFERLCSGVSFFGSAPFLTFSEKTECSDAEVQRLAEKLCASFTPRELQQKLDAVHGLRLNLNEVGMTDTGIWEVHDLALKLYYTSLSYDGQ